jgi:trehalose 6-phosphate synthase
MNLVAKEYVACRHDGGGALVLSEFAGAWHELHQAYVCNPHDIAGLKQTIVTAMTATEAERRRRMRAMRRRVADHDVQRWAGRFLEALECAPSRPRRTTREQTADDAHAAADQRAVEARQAARSPQSAGSPQSAETGGRP